MTGGHRGERLWNESAGPFIYLAHPISQGSILMEGFWGGGVRVGGLQDVAVWLLKLAEMQKRIIILWKHK